MSKTARLGPPTAREVASRASYDVLVGPRPRLERGLGRGLGRFEKGERPEKGGGRGRRPHVITCNRWAQDYVTSTWPSAPYYCTNAWDLREMDLLWPARCHGL